MGLGRTTIALAVIDLLDAYPALILCPPHLVPKWIREAEEVIPGAKGRELRRIGKGEDDEINDVRRFFEDFDAGRLGSKLFPGATSANFKEIVCWVCQIPRRHLWWLRCLNATPLERTPICRSLNG